MTIASRIYAQDGFQVCRKYKRRVKKTLGAKIGQLNFTDSANAAKVINDWVIATTNGKIQELLSAGTIKSQSSTRLTAVMHLVRSNF